MISVVIINLVIGIQSKNVLIIILDSLFLCLCGVLVFFAIFDIQWMKIEGSKLIVYNMFGRIKEYEIAKTKSAFFIDATLFQGQGIIKKAPCLVFSLEKSLKVGDVMVAFNRKKYPYVIIPYTSENLITIKQIYVNETGHELDVR